MTNVEENYRKKIWFITGSGRGMGVDIVRSALAKGHRVVATGRNRKKLEATFGTLEDLWLLDLDITNPESVLRAVSAAVDRFGGIDVLVNNAGNFYAGFFEELSPEQFRAQIETNLFGPLTVTRSVLPILRKQRSGLIVTFSSTAGIVASDFTSAYAASKFALEGWNEALTSEVAPFGIRTMIVEPGFFRTDLLEEASTTWAELSISDYAERTEQTKAIWKSMNGKQGGDPAKLAAALVKLADLEEPPLRWVAGADAVMAVEEKAKTLLLQAGAFREISSSLAHD